MAKKRRKDEKPVWDIEEIYGPEVAAAFAQRMHQWFDELDVQGIFPQPQRSAEIVPFPRQPKKRHSSDGGTA